MSQADDDAAALGLQSVHLLLGNLEHLLSGREGDALDLAGVGLGGGLRGLQAEHADLGAVRRGEDLVVAEGGLSVIQGVGGKDGELGGLGELHQVVVAIVEFVVAQSCRVVARQVHQLNSGGALGGADGGIALDEVACVKEQDIGPALLIVLLQGRHLGVSGDAAVNVVGVQDDGAAGEVGVSGCDDRLFGAGGHSQGTGHDQCQQQGQELFHARSSFSDWVHVRESLGTGYCQNAGIDRGESRGFI